MKKPFLVCTVLCLIAANPAYAKVQHTSKHAVDNLYTRALNNVEAAGMFNTLESQKNVKISDMHIDHGQVFITLDESAGPVTIIYDPIANKLVVPANTTP